LNLPIKIETLHTYYSINKKNFIVIDKVLYYTKAQTIIIENLFFKCVEIAGNEHALAKYTSKGNYQKFQKHKKAFQRMSFKKSESIEYYSALFQEYLEKHHQLFDNKVEV